MEVDDAEYCRLLLDLTSQDGWKLLTSDFERDFNTINSVVATGDNDDLNFRKGQLNIIASVLNLRERVIELSERLESDI
tara:strand:+ start:950 stop:1186 length:237 start_codon:yes stop_codon:yes gene_type:complete